MFSESLVECNAPFNLGVHIANECLKVGGGETFAEHVKGLKQRHAGVQQRGQLAGHLCELVSLNAWSSCAPQPRWQRPLTLDLGGSNALLTQPFSHIAWAIRLHFAPQALPLSIVTPPCITMLSHGW